MASRRVQNSNAKTEKRTMTKHEQLHQIATILQPHMKQWMTVGARLKTYGEDWPYDKEKDAKCTSDALAQAGFEMTDAADACARCVCCAKEMYWDATDDPFDEHRKHAAQCYFVLEGKPASEMTILDYMRMNMWRSAFEKTHSYREYVKHLQDAMDSARMRCHGLLIEAERNCRTSM